MPPRSLCLRAPYPPIPLTNVLTNLVMRVVRPVCAGARRTLGEADESLRAEIVRSVHSICGAGARLPTIPNGLLPCSAEACLHGQRRWNRRLWRRLVGAPAAVAGRPVGRPLFGCAELRSATSRGLRRRRSRELRHRYGGHFDHAGMPIEIATSIASSPVNC